MKKILIVDDEVQILKALSRMFLETDYEIFIAENGMEALKMIENTDIDMVISDMRMPILDGYQLLSIVKEKYPKIIRIILSGYAEEKPMFRALLHNVAKLYVFKPWNNAELLDNINKLFTDDVVLNSEDLVKSIKDMGCKCEMPANCKKIIDLIEEENMDALVDELESEADLSSLLIQVGKSAVYGVMPNTAFQVAHYIGLHNLKSFIHWACAINSTKQVNEISTEPAILWQHAYLSNRIFLFLYETFFHKQPPEATMFAGLMHNIGLIVLSSNLLNSGILSNKPLTADDYAKLDLEEYEYNHQEIGGYLLDMWDLPFPMYEVALYHHRPTSSCIVNHELVSSVHIAQHYAWVCLGATVSDPVSDEIFEHLEINIEDFEKRLSRYLKCEHDLIRSKISV
ncbi:MAG: signal transduction protein [Herbinix sp.]|jgi:response regulator RpfG family c-di-GMP phosphodiesterase|nr:signal transduction protein [Herbinix sp.]